MAQTQEQLQPQAQAQAQAQQEGLNGAQQEVRAAELQTGTAPVMRAQPTELGQDDSSPAPSELDPRFDKDDLRQGKAPPATRKGGVLHLHRPSPKSAFNQVKKVKKVRKLVPIGGKKKGNGEGAGGQEQMEEVEVEVSDDEEGNEAEETKQGDTAGEHHKSGGLVGKLFHKS